MLGQSTKNSISSFIGHQISHLGSISGFFKMVLVVPDFVRPRQLYIDKIAQRLHMGYFCDPGNWNASNRAYFVFDNASGIYVFCGVVEKYPEIEI